MAGMGTEYWSSSTVHQYPYPMINGRQGSPGAADQNLPREIELGGALEARILSHMRHAHCN